MNNILKKRKLILQLYNKGREDSLEVIEAIAPVLSNTYSHFEIITSEKHLEWLKVGDIFEKICLLNSPNNDITFKNFRVSKIYTTADSKFKMIKFINTAIDN